MSEVDKVSEENPPPCPLHTAIERGLLRLGEGEIYEKLGSRLESEFSLTGSGLRALSFDLAANLRNCATPPRRVAIVTPAGPEFLVAIVAGIYAGLECVAPPFPKPGPTRKRFSKIMAQCRPDCVLAAKEDIPALREELDAIGLGHVEALPIALETSFNDVDAASARLPDAQCRILQHTSGTSGSPRAVVLTGANVAANVELITRSWQFTTRDSLLTWLPHHHDMGLFGCIITPLVVGMTIHQMSPFTFLKRPLRWMEALSLTRATTTGGPAFAMRLAIEAGGPIKDLDLGHVRRVFCGSEPVPPDLIQRFATHFAPAGLSPEAVFACYGLAESTLYVAGRPGAGLAPACDIFDDGGVHSLRVVDPETRLPVEDAQKGEIWFSGPSIASAYLDEPEESAATFKGTLEGDPTAGRSWLRTGDIGWVEGGALNICGRIKDMIIANGANVPASEIEWTACACDPVFDGMAASCFAYGDLAEARTAIIIEIEKRAAKDLDPDAARRKIRAAVRSEHGVDLSDIRFVRRGELPRTTSGKVQRRAVRQMLLDGALVELGGATNCQAA